MELKSGFYTALGTPLDECGNLVAQSLEKHIMSEAVNKVEKNLVDNQELIIIADKVNTMPTTRGLCYKCHK